MSGLGMFSLAHAGQHCHQIILQRKAKPTARLHHRQNRRDLRAGLRAAQVQPVVHRGLQPRRSQPCLMHGTSNQRREIASWRPLPLRTCTLALFRSLKCIIAQDLQFAPRTGPKPKTSDFAGSFYRPLFICIGRQKPGDAARSWVFGEPAVLSRKPSPR